jgi:uncharacterized protein YjiS (DUF1127 family)
MEEPQMSFHASNYTKSTLPVEGTFRSFAERMNLSLVRKYRAHKTTAALSALSDSELDDIGLVRADIAAVVARVSL